MSRLRLALALGLTIALGLLSRRVRLGWSLWDKSLGDVLYAVAAYLALALVWPAWPRRRLAALALAGCLLVETFQATGIPASYADSLVVRYLVGTTFSWHDVLCYVVGVALAFTASPRPAPAPPPPSAPPG